MKEEIERIINLLPKLVDIERENNVEEIKKAGFKSIDDYNFIKSIQDKFNNFMQYIQEWEGLEECIPTIKRTFVYIHILREKNINV